MERKTILEIIIEDCVFPKEFNYFLTIHEEGEGEKRRTEISQFTKNPKFVENKFFIEINNPAIGKSVHEPYSSIINFSAFIVLNNNSLNKSTNLNNNLSKNPESTEHAKLLGENFIKFSELLDKLLNSKDEYIKHNLNLVRRNEKDIDVVGKINLLLKLTYFSEINKENIKNSLNIAKNDDIHELPEIDNKIPFLWRMRIVLRSAINVPFRNPSLNTVENLPSVFIEMGWTQYEKEDLNFNECIKSSYIERNRFPIWNQEFIYYPNQDKNLSNKNIDGFFNISIRDIDSENPIKKISFPLNYLRSFHPINADFEFFAEGQKEKSHLFITLILEEINCDNEDELLNTIQNVKDTSSPFFLSNTLNLPISKNNNQYNAIQNFVFPRSFLDKNLYFYLYIRDLKLLNNHAMPNVLVGRIEMVQDLLKFSLNSKKNDVVPFKFYWDPNSLSHGSVVNSRCIMEFSVRNVIDKSNEHSSIKSPNNSNYGNSFYKIKQQKEEYLQRKLIDVNIESSEIQPNEKWDLLSRELTQKQELIKRILQDVDDKTQMINLKGNEITELRKEINSLKNENSNLKLKLGLEQQIQIDTTITEEIENMSNKDLKTKILKMAQVYRVERLRNEELEKSLRKAKQEISNAKNLNQQYNQLLKKHQEDSKNLVDLQANVQKIGMFRETINKQEEVIVKLEKLLKNSIEDVNKQKKDIFELERLKTENLKLQTDLKNYLIKNTIQDGTTVDYNNQMNMNKYRNEISRLENLVKNLQEKLNNSKDNVNTSLNRKNSKENSETIKIELEIKYSQALEKINILENELGKITKQYAEEISRLKIKISQKEAYLSNKK